MSEISRTNLLLLIAESSIIYFINRSPIQKPATIPEQAIQEGERIGGRTIASSFEGLVANCGGKQRLG